jgi:glycosyltransferase involved in cell wall biosynthesis
MKPKLSIRTMLRSIITARLAGKLAGAVVVNTRHGLALHSASRQEIYFKAVLPLTSAVVFVCEYGRRYFAQKGMAPESKSEVILNGIPLEPFRQMRAAPGSMRPKIRFGTIGRLVKAKAHGDLLEAFALVMRDLPQAELDIWGYGDLRAELESRIAALGLRNCVRYRGPASNPAEALWTLDIFTPENDSGEILTQVLILMFDLAG